MQVVVLALPLSQLLHSCTFLEDLSVNKHSRSLSLSLQSTIENEIESTPEKKTNNLPVTSELEAALKSRLLQLHAYLSH